MKAFFSEKLVNYLFIDINLIDLNFIEMIQDFDWKFPILVYFYMSTIIEICCFFAEEDANVYLFSSNQAQKYMFGNMFMESYRIDFRINCLK